MYNIFLKHQCSKQGLITSSNNNATLKKWSYINKNGIMLLKKFRRLSTIIYVSQEIVRLWHWRWMVSLPTCGHRAPWAAEWWFWWLRDSTHCTWRSQRCAGAVDWDTRQRWSSPPSTALSQSHGQHWPADPPGTPDKTWPASASQPMVRDLFCTVLVTYT